MESSSQNLLASKFLLQRYEKEIIQSYNKKFSIKFHKESKFLMLLRPLIKLFNPTFFESTKIFLFNTLYVPEKFYEGPVLPNLNILAHEGIHAYDKARFGNFFFYTYYFFPQILIPVFLVLAFAASLWFLLPAVVCFFAPSFFRYLFEVRAYLTFNIFNEFVYKIDNDISNEAVAETLSSWHYFMAWPFKSMIRKRMRKGADITSTPYKDIVMFLKKYGLVKKY